MKTTCKRVTSALLTLVMLLSTLNISGTTALATDAQDAVFNGKETIRAYGETRVDTSIATAELMKKSLDVSKFDTMILACSDKFADALSGSYLACQKKAPILILDSNSTDSYSKQKTAMILNYVVSNLNPGGRVYLLGGTSAITDSFATDLKTAMTANNLGTNLTRLSGENRFDTNIAIIKEGGVAEQPLVVCSGNDFADALSASALGYPILIVNTNLTDAQKSYLATIQPTSLYIMGGTSAVSDEVANEVSTALNGMSPTRIGGETRYETSAQIAETFFDSTTTNAVTIAWVETSRMASAPVRSLLPWVFRCCW